MDRLQSKQILLIADANPENVDVLKAILSPDFDIRVATDAQETIELASSPDTPALILLNIMMPSVDMYAVCRQLKAGNLTQNSPILLLSEPTEEDTEAKGFESGAADYITKPFKPSVVKARIQTHLELKRIREIFENRIKNRVSQLDEEIQQRRDIEDTYRSLVKHARDGIVIIHDFSVKFANPAFCKMIGISQKELIGAHLKKFISEEEFVKNTKRYSERIAGLNLPRIYKSQIMHSDGSTIDVELNVSVIPYGRSLAALVFVRDTREEEAWLYNR
jgi:PAS domain S-box-containing protein